MNLANVTVMRGLLFEEETKKGSIAKKESDLRKNNYDLLPNLDTSA